MLTGPALISKVCDTFVFRRLFSKPIQERVFDPLIMNNGPVSSNEVVIEDLFFQPLGFYFYKHVLESPESIAVKCQSYSISYGNLNAKVNQFASYLISRNIKVGDVIGLSMDKSINMVICFLGTLKAGATYLPLDPSLPVSRISYMLRDSKAKVLIASGKSQHVGGEKVDTWLIEDVISQIDDFPADELNVELKGNDLAYILYTSGSTGNPKGVMIEHHSLVNLILSVQTLPGLNKHDVFLSITTISFDIFQLELHLPLISGAKLILADTAVCKDGRRILDLIKREDVSVMQATPYTWRMMLDSGWKECLPLKAFCGGEAMSKMLVSDLLPKCSSLWNMYGPTETTIYSIIAKISNSDAVVPIGKPIKNTQVYILDEFQSPTPAGEVGEIFIGGVGVARGYINLSELTRERFIPDVFTKIPGKTLYRTGDLGKLDADGNIICLGRSDYQIKIRGFRIEAGEVEDNLLQLRSIAKAIVVGHTDRIDNQRLIAYIILKDDKGNLSLDEHVRSWTTTLKTILPDYMIPNTFIQLQELPVSSNGKIDRNALPEPQFNLPSKHYTSPLTSTEKFLVEIWNKYLGSENVGTTDNFFALGGHSKVAVQIMVELEKRIGKVIPISSLFEYPTIQKLARLLDNYDLNCNWKSLVPIKTSGTRVPLYIVHGIGLNVLIFYDLVKCLDDDQPVFGLQSRGLDGSNQAICSIDEVASYYVAEMLVQNPYGPYVIAGYSMGGLIALEMAKQIQQSGREVHKLILIDTNVPITYGSNILSKLLRKITRQFYKAIFITKSFVNEPIETLRYQQLVLKAKIQEFRGITPTLVKGSSEINPVNIMETMSLSLEKAASQYVVRPYAGSIILYKALKRIYYVDDRKYLGWKKFALKGLTVRDVPGDHRDMLLEPNVREFAKLLQTDLNSNLHD